HSTASRRGAYGAADARRRPVVRRDRGGAPRVGRRHQSARASRTQAARRGTRLRKVTLMNITRNVVADLLPAYLSGEASADTRAPVDEVGAHDPEIAGLVASA